MIWNYLWPSIPLIHHTRGFSKTRNRYKHSKYLQKRYWSGIGSLLWILNRSQLKLSNEIHNLSKWTNEANTIQYKALLCAIRLDDLPLCAPQMNFKHNPSHYPPTSQLNRTTYSHTPAVETASEDNLLSKSLAHSFFFLVDLS